MTPSGFLTNHEIARMRALAKRDVPCRVIAAEIGCSASTVSRRARGLRPRAWLAPDLERARRIVTAAEHVPAGEREGLAARFGYANLASFNVMLCRYRKLLAAAPVPREASCDPETGRAEGGRG